MTSSTSRTATVSRSVARMADGRELIYFDETPHDDRVLDDPRDLPPVVPGSRVRYDALLGEWVGIAGHRQTRTYRPPAECLPAVPVDDVESERDPLPHLRCRGLREPLPVVRRDGRPGNVPEGGLFDTRPGTGRCEVVCFTSDHHALLSTLPQRRMRTVIEAWADRTAALSGAATGSSRCSASRTGAWRSA